MKNRYTYFLFAAAVLLLACNQSQSNHHKKTKRKPANYANYIIEVGTYKTRNGVKTEKFLKLDSLIEQVYTLKQPGFINKESGFDQKGNWLLVVSWDNAQHAQAAASKFMNSSASAGFKNMIDTASLHLQDFSVKEDHSTPLKDLKPFVIELATFRLNKNISRDTFEKRDLAFEKEYIANQDGYITRQSGVAANGDRMMMLYWKTAEDADNSIKQFKKDQSVADYFNMIDQSSVKLRRFKAVY